MSLGTVCDVSNFKINCGKNNIIHGAPSDLLSNFSKKFNNIQNTFNNLPLLNDTKMLQNLKDLLQNYIGSRKLGAEKRNESSLLVSTEAPLQTTISPDEPSSFASDLENEDNSKPTKCFKILYTYTYIYISID